MRWPARPDGRGAGGLAEAAADAKPAPALLLDRDGVLVVDRHYLADPADVTLIAGVPAALRRARAAGYRLIGVSNQSGIGRGRITSEQFDRVMARFTDLLDAAGAPLDAFFCCPHGPDEGCRCRKPGPGLLEEAEAVFTLDRRRSWVIGDKVSDVDLALRHGLRAVLVRTGHGAEQAARLGDRVGVAVADDLPAAIEHILAEGSP